MILSIWFLLRAGVNVAVGQDGRTVAKLAIESIENRSKSRNPIHVHFTVREFISASYREMTGVAPRPDLDKGFSNTSLEFEVRGEFARKGILAMSSDDSPDVAPRGLVVHDERRYDVYDGTKSVIYRRKTAPKTEQPLFGISPGSGQAGDSYFSPWTVCGEMEFLKQFGYLEKSGEQISQNIDGDIVELRVDAKPDSSAVARLDMSQDFALRSFVIDYPTGPDLHYDAEYKVTNGVLHPITAKMQSVDAGKVIHSMELLSIDVVSDPDSIPNELFRIELPADAAVFDIGSGDVIRDPKQVQRALDQIERGVRFDRSFWIVACNVVAVTSLVVFLIMRRRQRGTMNA